MAIFDWLTGRRRRRELPEYSLLRAAPGQALPDGLTREESAETLEVRRIAIEDDLRRTRLGPEAEAPCFFTLVDARGSGVVTMPPQNGGGPCVPVFSTPFRATDYKDTWLTPGPTFHSLVSTAAQLSGMLRALQGAGIATIALDCCPRCAAVAVTDIASLQTPGAVLSLWAIFKSTEMARLELYLSYALRSARAGQLEEARTVALATVSHVNLEDPRVHLLLGELGVALGDRTLVQEAHIHLRFFKHEGWEQTLAMLEKSGQPRFEGSEQS
jgi:hypothetical protein